MNIKVSSAMANSRQSEKHQSRETNRNWALAFDKQTMKNTHCVFSGFTSYYFTANIVLFLREIWWLQSLLQFVFNLTELKISTVRSEQSKKMVEVFFVSKD